MIDRQMAHGNWAMGEAFGLADCAALPAVRRQQVEPLGEEHTNTRLILNA
jgi:glutathione S-transferase